MRLVSPLLKRAVYPTLSKCGYLRRASPTGPAVVTYHGILPAGYRSVDRVFDGNLVTAKMFRQQLSLLKHHYNVIRPEEFLLWCEEKRELPPHSVLLTCDDCLQNNVSEMLPLLREADLACLFFATGASVSEEPKMLWYERLYLMLLLTPEKVSIELPEANFPAHET